MYKQPILSPHRTNDNRHIDVEAPFSTTCARDHDPTRRRSQALTPQEAALRGASHAFKQQQQEAQFGRGIGSHGGVDGGGLVKASAGARSPGTSPGRPFNVLAIAQRYGGAIAGDSDGSLGARDEQRVTSPTREARRADARNEVPLQRLDRQHNGASLIRDGSVQGPLIGQQANQLVPQLSGASRNGPGSGWQARDPKRASFLAANIAASRGASPGISPNHTGQSSVAAKPKPRMSVSMAPTVQESDQLVDELAQTLERPGATEGVRKGPPPRKPKPLLSRTMKSESELALHGSSPEGRTTPVNLTDTVPVDAHPSPPLREPRPESASSRTSRPPTIPKKKPELSSTSLTLVTKSDLSSNVDTDAQPTVSPIRSSPVSIHLGREVSTKSRDIRKTVVPKSEPLAASTSSAPGHLRGEDDVSMSPRRGSLINRTETNSTTTSRASSGAKNSVKRTSPDTLPPKLPPRLPQHTGSSMSSLAPTVAHLRNPATSSNLTVNSLASAIMAGSIASARSQQVTALNTKTPPPLPAPRRHKAQSSQSDSHKTSPKRSGMLQTLRPPLSKSDEEAERNGPPRRKPFINKKSHLHHEGARRRWREEVTEAQRKRYEAVWASNRGLYMPSLKTKPTPPPPPPSRESLPPPLPSRRQPGLLSSSAAANASTTEPSLEKISPAPKPSQPQVDPQDYVINIVARLIWSRSRLPAHELAEVWELVYAHQLTLEEREGDQQKQGPTYGALSKAEFVVGMWLIDQRLRGRKIPHRFPTRRSIPSAHTLPSQQQQSPAAQANFGASSPPQSDGGILSVPPSTLHDPMDAQTRSKRFVAGYPREYH